MNCEFKMNIGTYNNNIIINENKLVKIINHSVLSIIFFVLIFSFLRLYHEIFTTVLIVISHQFTRIFQ